MSNIVKGRTISDLVVKIGTRRRFTPGIGYSISEVYSAQTKDAADAFFGSYTGGSTVVDYNEQGPPFLIELSQPDSNAGDPNDDYVDQWTMPANHADRSIFEVDIFRALEDSTQRAIRKYANSKVPGDYDDAMEEALAQGEQPEAESILKLIVKGSDYFRTGQTSVKWTRTAGSGYNDASFASGDILKIWTTSQLLAVGQPPLIAALISAADAALESPEPGYLTGWLKQPIDVSPRGLDRFDITQEWILENWSSTMYFSK
jgi:hypothetical protein